MPLINLKLPPGIKRHGTDLESVGRWRDGDLVRWRNGSPRAIGGWTIRKASASAAAPRGGLAWTDNSGNGYVAFGSYNKLYTLTASGTLTDVTPVGLTAGNEDAQQNIGYGGADYNAGFYGQQRISGPYEAATTWSLDAWGEYMVACSSDDGVLYEWPLAGAAAAISGAPTGCIGLVVSQERFLFALAAGGNPRKVQWCDREDNTTWTPTTTNEAGDFELHTHGEIRQGLVVTGGTLILTDNDAHLINYIGPPFVHGRRRVGSNCGAASRLSAVSVRDGAFWMGDNSFFYFDGTTVHKLVCDVEDYVFDNLNTGQRSKTHAFHNALFNEVWWFYPSNDGTEVDRYVAYNYAEQYWMIGALDRTTAIDAGAFPNPVMLDSTGDAFDHEIGFNVGGNTPYLESGPIMDGNGDSVLHAVQLYPDEKVQGEVTATFKTRYYANDTEYTHGPYTMSAPTDVRFSGRQIRMRVDAVAPGDWSFGAMRLDVRPGETR
jgi:hypothetical protein